MRESVTKSVLEVVFRGNTAIVAIRISIIPDTAKTRVNTVTSPLTYQKVNMTRIMILL